MGVIRLVVVDWLVANSTSAFRRLPEARTRRVRAGDVGSLTEECDRRQEVHERHPLRMERACRSDLGTLSVDRPHVACPSVSLRVFIEREGEGA